MIILRKLPVTQLLYCVLCIALWFPVTASSQQVKVQIKGVEGNRLDNVKSYLQIANMDSARSYRPYQIRYLHRQAAKEIKLALQPFGYYQTEVSSSLKQESDSTWQATYNISLNDPVIIDENQWVIDGDAETDEQLTAVIKKGQVKTGRVFHHGEYEKQKSALLSRAIQRGYHQADFKRTQVIVDKEQNSAAVQVVLNSGPRYYFGELDISSSHLQDDLIRRYARFDVGEPYMTSELSKFQVDLSNSDYFSEVQIVSDWKNANANNQVPVRVETSANKKTHYRFGAGYGTDTGVRLTAGLDRRWVNNRGHQFRSAVQLAQYESRATAIYHIPGEKPQMDYHQLRTEIGNKDNESVNSQVYRVAALDVFTYDRWQREYDLSWFHEDFTVGIQNDRSEFLVPGVKWRYLSSDQRINVVNGWRISFGLRAAAGGLLSDADMVQGNIKFKSVWTLSERWRLLSRAEAGATYIDNFYRLPPSLRFFAGGDNSVRGYAYEQLGPEDPSQAVIGGRYLAVASAEFDYRIADSWRLAVFSDIGNTMIEPNQDLKQSIGFGLRWLSPVGAIRLDLAQAIDEPGNPWRLHFTLGPDL
ncbi:autotransporter assembly complex protein TamA [Idiomarina seosinensis]|uniref:autotransporter assembly complex protein TamA n=1 Tax=Idiomarina seosinensis TaxID=281739 RepID=UPI00384F8842